MTATGYVSTTGDTRKVDVAGDTMTGELVLPDSSPDTSLTAASKGYVDTRVATKVGGPGSSTDNAVPRFDGTAGLTLQNSTVTIADDGTVTITGALTVEGYTTLEGGQFNSNFAAFGDMTLIGTGKRYRLRRSGSALDFEGSGVDMVISMWSAEDFTGSQRSYFRLSANAQNVQVAGKVEFVDALYTNVRHVLDGAANTLGFHGATPVARQTVTGSRGGNAALADLLTKLANLGLIVDGTSA